VRDSICRALRGAGFQVMPIADVDEAIDLLCLVSFDLVLADVGSLRYTTARPDGLAAMLSALRATPLLRFSTAPPAGLPTYEGALALDQPARDLPVLLDAVQRAVAAPAR
jgi:hypothetical protein